LVIKYFHGIKFSVQLHQLFFKAQWITLKGEAIDEIIKTNPGANFFLDEMPFDDFKPNNNGDLSIVSLTNIVGQDKFIWAACRIQSTTGYQELQGIKYKNCCFFKNKTKIKTSLKIHVCPTITTKTSFMILCFFQVEFSK